MKADIEYVNDIFKKFNIEGWNFLQANPNDTYTFQCTFCRCAFALPDIDSIANYHYCPSCAKFMINHTKNNYPCFAYPQTIDILAKLIDQGVSFEELVDYFEIPEDQVDTVRKMIYSRENKE